MARVVWGTIGKVIGAHCSLKIIWQSLTWFYTFLPGGNKFYMLGIVAICWGILTERNKTTFDGHMVRSPVGVIFTICSLLLYWLGLLKGADKEILTVGVQVLMEETARLSSLLVPATDGGADS